MRISVAFLLAVSGTTAFGQDCRQPTVHGYVKGGQTYSLGIGEGLEFRLSPLEDNWGWVVSVSPEGSVEDWTFPVNLPLRTGESQLLGTGYGATARDRMRRPATVRFVLTESDYTRYSKLASEALYSQRAETASEYLEVMPKIPSGAVTVEATEYDDTGAPEVVKWMRFKASITVPESFHRASDLKWLTIRCSLTR